MPDSIHACTYPCKSSTVTASVRGANYPEWSCLATAKWHSLARGKKILRMHIISMDDIKKCVLTRLTAVGSARLDLPLFLVDKTSFW